MPAGKLETRQKILNATWELMEARPHAAVNMGEIAQAAGISRQALYLHFETRTQLMLATVRHVDEVKGLNERLAALESARSAIELLDSCVEVWGNYIPEIYGLARALRNTRDQDEASAAAWSDAMRCVRDICVLAVDRLRAEGLLHADWSRREAVELMWSLVSIESWEQLVQESKFTTRQFIKMTRKTLHKTLLSPEALDSAAASRASRPSRKESSHKNVRKTARKASR